MRYVIIRDDDTNALTPVECLERLYRPFLNRGLPVNLAVIPDVATDVTVPDGRPEGFLYATDGVKAGVIGSEREHATDPFESSPSPPSSRGEGEGAGAGPHFQSNEVKERTLPIASNPSLVKYLRDHSCFRIVQHGCHHDYFEFDSPSAEEVSRRLDRGTQLLMDAGFARPDTFVAPYDKLSRVSLWEVAKRFRVLSTGWFEWRRLPMTWWPRYALKKARHAPHWNVGRTLLLSHPGCLLSCQRNYQTMMDTIINSVHSRRLTVLVTHWWEYFRDGQPDEPFIHLLHRTADYLATRPDVSVISFSDLAENRVRLS